MIWFLLHNFIKQFDGIDVQTKNLTVFLIGVTIYTFVYSWLGSNSRNDRSFSYFFFNFFTYVILADAFSMAIIYKNYFNKSIFNEVKETFGAPPEDKYKNIPLKEKVEMLNNMLERKTDEKAE